MHILAADGCFGGDGFFYATSNYGVYSNVTRGRLKKEKVEPEFHIIEDECPGGQNRSFDEYIIDDYIDCDYVW